jgi:hypothetical protein
MQKQLFFVLLVVKFPKTSYYLLIQKGVLDLLELNNPVPIDQKFPGILSKYELHVRQLYIDSDAIRIEYKITPPVPPVSLDIPNFLLFTWGGYARDNHDGDYQSAGGACGLSLDGEYTDGILSFLPLPNEEINRLDITMVTERITPEIKCEFSVSF